LGGGRKEFFLEKEGIQVVRKLLPFDLVMYVVDRLAIEHFVGQSFELGFSDHAFDVLGLQRFLVGHSLVVFYRYHIR
jgi:hypothetical protein